MASMMYGIGNTGMPNPSTARVEMSPDGAITVFTGSGRHRPGVHYGSAADSRRNAMDVKPDEIRMVVADTRYTTSRGSHVRQPADLHFGKRRGGRGEQAKDMLLTEAAMILRVGRVRSDGERRSRSI